MSETLDRETALRLLGEVVADFGEDYVYPTELRDVEGVCLYWASGKPACLVGHVLHRWGVDVELLKGGAYDLPNQGVALTEDALEVLADAQRAQDQRMTWGYALERAQRA